MGMSCVTVNSRDPSRYIYHRVEEAHRTKTPVFGCLAQLAEPSPELTVTDIPLLESLREITGN